jgi:hypothetical protein
LKLRKEVKRLLAMFSKEKGMIRSRPRECGRQDLPDPFRVIAKGL